MFTLFSRWKFPTLFLISLFFLLVMTAPAPAMVGPPAESLSTVLVFTGPLIVTAAATMSPALQAGTYENIILNTTIESRDAARAMNAPNPVTGDWGSPLRFPTLARRPNGIEITQHYSGR